TATNFSSPDIFAGLDLDFTWYTSQKCLSYPFEAEHVRLATLVAADEQCTHPTRGKAKGQMRSQIRGTAKPKDQGGETQIATAALNAAMLEVSDPATLTALDFLSRLDYASKDPLPERLHSLMKGLVTAVAEFSKPTGELDREKIRRRLLAAIAKLVN